MNSSTITPSTFTLVQSSETVDGGVNVDGGVSFNTSTNTATFTPDAPLRTNRLYTATITGGARSSAGNSLAGDYNWSFTTGPAPVELGTAKTYAVLGETMANTGIVIVNGDLGVGAGGITGSVPFVYGTTHDGGAVAQARLDLVAAYTNAAARMQTSSVAVVDAVTLTAGVYKTVGALTGMTTLTLDGEGNPNAVFIFQITAGLTMTGGGRVNLINGAQASNVFWQVGAAAGTGASSNFRGTILAYAAISLGASNLVEGRALSRTASVNLDSTTIGTRISDGGYGALAGTSAFTVRTCRAFATLFPDGGVDSSGVRVELANVDSPCAPLTPTVGALTLEAYSSDGGRGQGDFVSNGTNIYVVGNPDAGSPLRDFGAGLFSIRWWSSADPTQGVTGTLNVTLGDGGTVVGTFAGSYCGPN